MDFSHLLGSVLILSEAAAGAVDEEGHAAEGLLRSGPGKLPKRYSGIARMLLVVRPGTPNSFLLLVVGRGKSSSFWDQRVHFHDDVFVRGCTPSKASWKWKAITSKRHPIFFILGTPKPTCDHFPLLAHRDPRKSAPLLHGALLAEGASGGRLAKARQEVGPHPFRDSLSRDESRRFFHGDRPGA